MAGDRHDSDESNGTPSTPCSSPICRTRPARTTTAAAADDGGGDGVDCSRGCCESCVAGAIADAVAICCCPCAVVDLAAFVLVQVPWAVARRLVASARGKRKRKRIAECGGGPRRGSGAIGRTYSERWRVNEGMIEVTTSFNHTGEEEESEGVDERVWSELCRGFGRLSFNGIQSAGKGS
uniref:Uncharacterized protein n=1 Tax=Kalanchoe fedtschenkoi TaxID=63787 RepID=A0A7N0U4L1_KALFE